MGYRKGQWVAICDVCGFRFHIDEMRKTWNGLLVDKRCYEGDHPQKFLRVSGDPRQVPNELIRQCGCSDASFIVVPYRDNIPITGLLSISGYSPTISRTTVDNSGIILTYDEGLDYSSSSIGNFYNGIGGPSYGVVHNTSLAYKDIRPFGFNDYYFNFANNPSGFGCMSFNGTSSITISISSGVTSRISLAVASDFAFSVTLYSEINGSGSIITGGSTYSATGLSSIDNAAFSYWKIVPITFTGTVKSIMISGVAYQTLVDSIVFGDVNYVYPRIPSFLPSANKGAVTFKSNGFIYRNGSLNQDGFDAWCSKAGVTGIGSNYWIRATTISGITTGAATGQWLSLSSDQTWNGTCIKIEIASDSQGNNIIASTNNELLSFGTSIQHIMPNI